MTVRRGPTDRRAFLAATAGVLASSAGCLNRFQASVDRETPEQVSLSITTVPNDEDSVPVRIARHLAENLETAGIDVGLQPVTTEQLWRDVLLNHDFDIYIGQHPGYADPDYLYGLLHSQFSEEAGWQNPFGYVNVPGVDEPLETQRETSDGTREGALSSLVEGLREEAPFSVVAYPEEPRALRTDRYRGWGDRSLESPLGLLDLEEVDGRARDDRAENTLQLGISDGRITNNLNPLAVEYRRRWIVTGLLYDPLGRHVDGGIVPWLAADWSWDEDRLRIRLREDLAWHDGEALTAADVAFTYRLLWDTTYSEDPPIVPAPCFRSRSTLVDAVEVIGERTLDLTIDAHPDVGLRALTVPVLPMHVWEERTDPASIAGFDFDSVTEALVADNMEPVGSGPLRFEDVTTDERLELVRNEDHFLTRLTEGPLEAFAGGPAYERLVFDYSPSPANVIEAVGAGQIDASAAALPPTEIDRIRGTSGVELVSDETSAHYHVGFNARNAPLSNPRFRRAAARLFDREYLRTEVFAGDATPAFSPIAAAGPSDDWHSGHEAGFVGESGTGEVDAETARDLFYEAGYIYNEDGEMVIR
ncbi:ABC transporter substrate-binding protein [Halalkalicoccus tibetensis]|uniref:ABC transporter substrate-binding protein n=1 Tax=Halalkalicoccus tibetensis TaxID=175632 RepID=A0ABD5V207_9EURY